MRSRNTLYSAALLCLLMGSAAASEVQLTPFTSVEEFRRVINGLSGYKPQLYVSTAAQKRLSYHVNQDNKGQFDWKSYPDRQDGLTNFNYGDIRQDGKNPTFTIMFSYSRSSDRTYGETRAEAHRKNGAEVRCSDLPVGDARKAVFQFTGLNSIEGYEFYGCELANDKLVWYCPRNSRETPETWIWQPYRGRHPAGYELTDEPAMMYGVRLILHDGSQKFLYRRRRDSLAIPAPARTRTPSPATVASDRSRSTTPSQAAAGSRRSRSSTPPNRVQAAFHEAQKAKKRICHGATGPTGYGGFAALMGTDEEQQS